MPLLALRTSPLKAPIGDDLNGLQLCQLYHFSHPRQADASQSEMAIRTIHETMLDHLRSHRADSSSIGPGLPFLSRLFLVC